jgi:transcriptional regulator with XRE-family HTH domain
MLGVLDNAIGRQVRNLRKDADLTQVELATAAGVSVDVVRKAEQGRKIPSLPTLHKLASALDVELSTLLSKPHTLPAPTEHSGVLAMRRAVSGIDDLLDANPDVAQFTSAQARSAATYAWGSYWAGRYGHLGEVLPGMLLSVRAVDDPRIDVLASRLYQVTACTLVHLAQPDAAHLALREAMRLASRGDDPLQAAALRSSLAWLLLTQGRLAESRKLALSTARDIEPGDRADLPRMSLWGSLLLSGATAAGRMGERDNAAHMLDQARQVAAHTGHRNDFETAFGPDQVTMQAVGVDVVTEHYAAALTTARKLPRTTPLPLAAKSRHLADRALALSRLGRDEDATTTLLTMDHLAPDWMQYQALPRVVIGELLQRERRRGSKLRELARRLQVTMPIG